MILKSKDQSPDLSLQYHSPLKEPQLLEKGLTRGGGRNCKVSLEQLTQVRLCSKERWGGVLQRQRRRLAGAPTGQVWENFGTRRITNIKYRMNYEA